MITFVTVVLNDISGLKRTVTSLLNQVDKRWRLIIKDGRSVDGSTQFAIDLAQRHENVTSIVRDDLGIYDAMNQALSEVSSEYVAFLNAGDELFDNKTLSDVNRCVQENSFDIAFFNTLVCYEGGKTYLRRSRPSSYILYGQPAIHQSTIYRTELHKNYMYDLTYPVSSDYATTLKMCINERSPKIASFNRNFSKFEVVNNSTSFKKQRESRIEMARAQKEIANLSYYRIRVYRIRRALANFAARMLYRYSKATSSA